MFNLLGKPSLLKEFTEPVHLTLNVQSYKKKKKEKIGITKTQKRKPRKLLLLITKIKSVFDNILDIF